MNGLDAPSITSNTGRIEANNSCNCCCFPWIRRKDQIEAEIQIERSLQRIQEVKDSVFYLDHKIDPYRVKVPEKK